MIHSIIKVLYIREGYLPNYPYHMISDDEMFDAFLRYNDADFTLLDDINHPTYFVDNYYYPSEGSLTAEYADLCKALAYHIEQYRKHNSDVIPDWVYSYMLGAVVGPNSDKHDIHDLFVMLGCDNEYDEWSDIAYDKCLDVSKRWTSRAPAAELQTRPPTMFGEPHVIKSLRLKASNS